MGKRSREHREAVRASQEQPFRQPGYQPLFFVCYKCGNTLSEGGIEGHLKECQPAGAKCGSCGKIIKPEGFLDHARSCKPTPEDIIKMALEARH